MTYARPRGHRHLSGSVLDTHVQDRTRSHTASSFNQGPVCEKYDIHKLSADIKLRLLMMMLQITAQVHAMNLMLIITNLAIQV